MKKPALTREEITCLLRGLSGGAPPEEAAESLLRAGWHQVAESLAAEFSAIFRSVAAVEPKREGRATLGQFLLGCDQSTCLFRLAVEDGSQAVWIKFDLPLMFALLERLLGGRLTLQQAVSRPLTDLEKKLAIRVVAACARAIATAWPAMPVAMPDADAAGRIERAWLTSKSPLVCCDLQVQLEEVRGSVSLAIPSAVAGFASRGDPDKPRRTTLPPPAEPVTVRGVDEVRPSASWGRKNRRQM